MLDRSFILNDKFENSLKKKNISIKLCNINYIFER